LLSVKLPRFTAMLTTKALATSSRVFAVGLGARRGLGADGHAAARAVLDHDGGPAGLLNLFAHQGGR